MEEFLATRIDLYPNANTQNRTEFNLEMTIKYLGYLIRMQVFNYNWTGEPLVRKF